MYNFYPRTKGQSAIRDLFRVVHDRIGNVPPLRGIFPVYRYRSCASLAAQCENQDCCNSDIHRLSDNPKIGAVMDAEIRRHWLQQRFTVWGTSYRKEGDDLSLEICASSTSLSTTPLVADRPADYERLDIAPVELWTSRTVNASAQKGPL